MVFDLMQLRLVIKKVEIPSFLYLISNTSSLKMGRKQDMYLRYNEPGGRSHWLINIKGGRS